MAKAKASADGEAVRARPEVRGTYEVHPIDELVPNDWNVNEMDDRQYQAARESIRRWGFVDPVTVRRAGRKLEIIDGEHRWMAARDEKLTHVSVLVVDHLPNAEAKKLTLSLNLHGEPDTVKLARLLKELQGKVGDDVGVGLPYSPQQLAALIQMADADPTSYATAHPGELTSPFQTMLFRVPPDAAGVIERAILAAMTQGESEDRGVALERICADFLAGSAGSEEG